MKRACLAMAVMTALLPAAAGCSSGGEGEREPEGRRSPSASRPETPAGTPVESPRPTEVGSRLEGEWSLEETYAEMYGGYTMEIEADGTVTTQRSPADPGAPAADADSCTGTVDGTLRENFGIQIALLCFPAASPGEESPDPVSGFSGIANLADSPRELRCTTDALMVAWDHRSETLCRTGRSPSEASAPSP